MALEPLLWFCLDREHQTSISDERLGLSIKRQKEETILLFHTDSKEFREHFCPRRGPQIACDALFFYKYADKSPVLIFVELKGANLEHALDQLKATISAIKPRVERAVRGSTKYLALVISDGAGPTTRVNKQRDFEEKTHVDLRVRRTARGKKAVDLRAVLRDVEELSPFVSD